MGFETWLRSWLARHPLKEPAGFSRAAYTAQVMAKVQSLQEPAQAIPSRIPGRLWLPWPRLALGLATAGVAMALIVSTIRASGARTARATLRDVELLAALDQIQDAALDQIKEETEELLDELETVDALLLAEAAPSTEEQWLEETLLLLEESGEMASEDDEEDLDEDWLDDLEWLDEPDLAASS